MFNYSHIFHISLNLNDLTRHELLKAMGGRLAAFACDPCAQGGTPTEAPPAPACRGAVSQLLQQVPRPGSTFASNDAG